MATTLEIDTAIQLISDNYAALTDDERSALKTALNRTYNDNLQKKINKLITAIDNFEPKLLEVINADIVGSSANEIYNLIEGRLKPELATWTPGNRF